MQENMYDSDSRSQDQKPTTPTITSMSLVSVKECRAILDDTKLTDEEIMERCEALHIVIRNIFDHLLNQGR